MKFCSPWTRWNSNLHYYDKEYWQNSCYNHLPMIICFHMKLTASLLPSPAVDFGWHDPGYIHSAVMTGLNPSSTFSYRYGRYELNWIHWDWGYIIRNYLCFHVICINNWSESDFLMYTNSLSSHVNCKNLYLCTMYCNTLWLC